MRYAYLKIKAHDANEVFIRGGGGGGGGGGLPTPNLALPSSTPIAAPKMWNPYTPPKQYMVI